MGADTHIVELTFDAADEYRPEPPPAPEIAAWKDGSIRIGIHTSIARDIASALETAHRLGANALQIFSSSPRMWARGSSRIAEAEASRFRARRKGLSLGPLVIHCNYLINLASPNPVLRTRSVQAFHQELVKAVALGADYLVAHPGSGLGRESQVCVDAVARSIRQAARGLKLGDLRILLENTAGQGNCLGAKFGELRAILDACGDLPVGICLDTAHWFASGSDVRSADGLEAALSELDRTIGLDRVAVLHVNDSKTMLGSRVDRHEHIGKGTIGLDAFGRILNHPLLAGRAFILETPIDKPGDDRRNVATLWRLVGRTATVVRSAPDGMPSRRRKKARTQRIGNKGLASKRNRAR
jgi:deoxyribonuclease IV